MTNPTIDILTPSGSVRLTAVPEKGSAREYMLMQKDEVRLKFTLAEAVMLHAGDRVEIDGAGVFEIMDETQRPQWDTSTGGYRYDITLQARYRKFANRLHRFSTDVSAPETKWTLTAGIAAHASRIAASMNAVAAKAPTFAPSAGGKWQTTVDASVDAEKCITLTYDGISILEAIDMVAREFECEWWVEGSTLHFGVCRHSTPIALESGRDLATLTRSDSSESKATRIYFQGDTRNIPSTYRHTLILHMDEARTESGILKFRDTLRDIPDEAFCEDVRSYLFREECDPMSITGEIPRGKVLMASDPGISPLLCDGGPAANAIRLVRHSSEFAPGPYMADLTTLQFKFYDFRVEGKPLTSNARLRYVLNVEVADGKGNTLLTETFRREWKKADNGGQFLLDGMQHRFDIPPIGASAAFVSFEITLEAETSGCGTPLTCVMDHNATARAGSVAEFPAMRQFDPYRFSVFPLTLQFRDRHGNPVGEPCDKVSFNPSVSSVKSERIFTMPAIFHPEGAEWFTIEKGVDLPFVPASFWTSDSVLANGEEATVNGVAERRLLLPLRDEDGNPLHGYLDTRPMEAEDEVIEEVMTLDDCYPGTETTITQLSLTETTYTDTYELSDGSEDKVQWKAWRFKCAMFGDSNPFNPKYRLDSETLKVTFRDITGPAGRHISGGALNGMTFELIYDREAKEFEIVRDTSTLLPNETVCPSVGDGMVLTGFDVRMFSDSGSDLMAEAERRLLARAREIVADINTDASTYEGSMMCDRAYEQSPDLESVVLTPGHRVSLTAPQFGLKGFQTRVLGFSIPLDIPYDNPSYTFGEKTAYSRLGRIEERLAGIERPSVAHSGGQASGGGAGYDADCYVSLDRTLIEVMCIPDSEDTEMKVPCAGELPQDVVAGMYVEGSRRQDVEWRLECAGCAAEIIGLPKDDGSRQSVKVRTLRVRILSLQDDAAIVTLTGRCSGFAASASVAVRKVMAGDETLHSLHISHPLVRIGTDSEGKTISNPEVLAVTTKCNDGSGLTPSQAGVLLFRTDNADDPEAWSILPREDGTALISIADFLEEHISGDGGKVRRIDFRWCSPDSETLVGEGCATLTEEGWIPYLEDGRLNFHDFEGREAIEGGIDITDPGYRMEVDFGGDNFLAWGEEKEVRCRVMQGWRDVSDKVAEWSISRDSGDEAEDAAWGLKPKARDFEGSIVLSLTEDDNDLRQGHALFTICARVEGDKTLTAQIEI